ncbi:glutathione S-transferase family protein [Plastoroseomonas arctica]|uniref:Glutathione S-transferase n=1 Tax=Plastoroseomonas arctica TaxID=1509237 RepID=A0AAF1KUB5_9PROT|nr:glutathione S-transferase [Plastoroseomonas arctica]MBR0655887.1 glutathione S-transferase [Plastoroseomonas arctica]
MARFLLHHAAKTRSFRILWLLEELGAEYEIIPHELQQGTHKSPDFLAINPGGKLPVLEDRGPDGHWTGIAICESAAICAYLGDAVPSALTPAIGTPERAAYATFIAYAAAAMEPALMDMAFPRAEPPRPGMAGWPDFATTVARVEAQVAASGGPFLLGSAFTIPDLMVGGLLQWVVGWGMLKPSPATIAYLAALDARPALARARAIDAPASA